MHLALALLVLQAPAEPLRASVPFTYHERVAFVQARLNGSERLFLLDTGANRSAVDARTAKELALPAGEPSEVEGTTGVTKVETARVELALGPLVARDLAVTVQDLGGSLRPPETHLDGILGSDFLASYVLEIDYLARELTLSQAPLEAPAWALPLELDAGIPRFHAQLDDYPTELRIDTGASLFETVDVYINIPTSVWDELQKADPKLAPVGS